MGFSLKKFLEEATAQINPFDNGKTAATVRAARQAPPPAQTMRKPAKYGVLARNPNAVQQSIARGNDAPLWQQPPKYGSNPIQSNINRFKDIFDANSSQDYFKRNYQAIQQNLPTINQSYADQQRALGNRRPYQNLGQAVFGNTARLANTVGAAGQEAVDTGRMLAAQWTNNPEALSNAIRENKEFKKEAYQPNSGLLGAGTIFDNPEEFNTLGAKELIKRTAGTAAGSFGEVAPIQAGKLLKGASAPVKYGGRFLAGASQAAVGDVGEQLATRKQFNPVQTAASAAFGGVLPLAGNAAGAATRRVTTKLARPKPRLPQGGAARLSKEQVAQLLDFADAQVGIYKARPSELTALTKNARAASAKTGVNLFNGSPETVRNNILDLVESFDGVRRPTTKLAPQPDNDVTRRLMLDYFKGKLPVKGSALSGEGAMAPRDLPASAKQKLMDNMRKLAKSEGGYVQIPGNPQREVLDRIDGLNNMHFAKSQFSSAEDIARLRPSMKRVGQVYDNAKSAVQKKFKPLDEGGYIQLPGKKPKGFIAKETKPRAGRKDTIRIKMGDEKLERTLQSEFDPEIPSVKQTELTPPDFSQKSVKKDFVDTTNKFLGAKEATKTRNVSVARKLPKLDDKQSLRLMDAIEEGADSKAFKGIPKQVRQILDAKHQELRNAGVDIGYLEDYFPHRWQNEAKVKQVYETLNLKAGIQNARELPTIAEGVRLGFKPMTTDYRKAINAYLDTADRLLENRRYFDTLKKQGLIAESGTRPQGMQVIDAPGLPAPRPFTDPDTGNIIQGNYYANPDVAKQLNKLFGDNAPHGAFEKTLDKTAGAASLMQDIGLSGGLPGTPINAFTIAQGTKEVLAGNLKSPIVATMKSFSKEGFNKYVDNNRVFVEALERQGIPLRTDYNLSSLADEVAAASGLKGKAAARLGGIWNKAFNDPTFKRFLPSLQIEMYKKVYNKQVSKGVSEEAAEKSAAQAVKNFYGNPTLAQEALRNQTASNVATTFLFAPKYRESMITFWKNNVKALSPNNITKPEYRNNVRFVIGAGISYAALDYLNKQKTGGHLWDNPDNKKDKALIPGGPGGKDIGLPFLSSIATVPRYAASGASNLVKGNTEGFVKDISGFLGFGARPLVDAFVTNENYFGDKIVEEGANPGEAAKQRAGYLLTQYQHPYIREGIRTAQGKNKSAAEAISKAAELPLRWYDPRYYTYDGEFNPRGKEGEKFTIAQQRKRASVKKQVKDIPNSLGLSEKQKASYEALNKVEFDDKGNMKFDDDPFYRAKRATALQDDGVFAAMKQKALSNQKLNGQPLDPIYTLPDDARRLILWKNTLPAGTKDPSVSKIYDQEWYQDFRAEQDQYYKEKKVWNKRMGYAGTPADKNPYPAAGQQLQKKLDYYYTLPKGTGERSAFLRSNPDVLKHWDRTEAWTNGERAMLGLGPVDEFTNNYATGRGRGSGRRGGRRTAKNTYKGPKFSYQLYGFGKPSSARSGSSLRDLVERAII